jgi:23S rRNA (adenine2030-N6)-methyltransferase
MLSYRHAFHAGNHADILKHAILSLIVSHLTKKDKPFSYIDTHAGAGIYALGADWARKTGEAERGIESLLGKTGAPEAIIPYLSLCRTYQANVNRYPGSPELARALSREEDQLTLMELHPTEIENLRANMGKNPRVHIHHRDGFSGLQALCPPEPRRGFALVDPSYETDGDYPNAVNAILEANRKWPVGIFALWYPILERRKGEIATLKERFLSSGISGILTAELRITAPGENPNAEGFGLLGSGMLIVRPPFCLDAELREILPWIARALSPDGEGDYAIEWLTKSE